MTRPGTRWAVAFAVIFLSSCAVGQEAGPHSLWKVYFLAGANAAKAKKWPEAEGLYNAAIKQAETDKPTEPYLLISKYSLGTVYFEEGHQDEASKVFDVMNPLLDPALVTPELRDLADALNSLGNSFYAQAGDEKQAATDSKLKDDALKKVNASSNWKYLFARRYFQWSYVIDSHFYSPHSPELQSIVGDLALADYQIAVYDDAIAKLVQLREIIDTSMQRDNALSRGSLAYSLASKVTADTAKNPLSIAAIDFYTGSSYEGEAGDVFREKPAEAVDKLAKAESCLVEGLSDAEFHKVISENLVRIYREHVGLLRQLKRDAEADKIQKLADKLVPPAKS